MKSKEVLKELNITRVTLSHYVHQGYIKATKLKNGQYDYNKESVENFKNGIPQAHKVDDLFAEPFSKNSKKEKDSFKEALADFSDNVMLVIETLWKMGLVETFKYDNLCKSKEKLDKMIDN